ncbi:hypothetical protein F5Y16DRAFT_395001 [Xylariaceae sp. FL0255]|nr:hypothetical protein F5Y16DRAFT_395001 [Xylariaceae sp. FL0255]
MQLILVVTLFAALSQAFFPHHIITIATTIASASATATHLSSAASMTSRPSPTCSVSPSKPSLAPIKVGPLNLSKMDGIRDTSGNVTVSAKNSTILLYEIPPSFFSPNASAGLCALQFRMPVCTELPKGYPCYSFSGLEQEVLSNSGMNFKLLRDDQETPWNSTALHQVFPGQDSIIGTFECGVPREGSSSIREMKWQITSVREFSLQFLQAGVGSAPKFHDGIGAWIVQCS